MAIDIRCFLVDSIIAKYAEDKELGKINLIYTEEQLLEILDANKVVYIYGAGRVADSLIKRLNRYNRRIQGVLTTNGDSFLRGIDAIKFSDVSQNILEVNALVIVAVNEELWNEIYYSL